MVYAIWVTLHIPDQYSPPFQLITWFFLTFILWIASLRSSVALSAVFFFLFTTFIILAAGEWTETVGVTKAGGWMGVLVSTMI